MLSLLLTLPILGAGVLFFLPAQAHVLHRQISLLISCLTFLLTCVLWIQFDNSSSEFQYVETFSWLSNQNISFSLGIDGISLFFLVLTGFLVPVCLLVGWVSVQDFVKEYCIAFLILESFMYAVFCIQSPV